eukprot:scaffold1522_cov166-Amphora_coffeaeformis.AAC.26
MTHPENCCWKDPRLSHSSSLLLFREFQKKLLRYFPQLPVTRLVCMTSSTTDIRSIVRKHPAMSSLSGTIPTSRNNLLSQTWAGERDPATLAS